MSKITYVAIILFTLLSCHSHIEESVVVRSIQTSKIDKYKYRVELDFFPTNQYLHTNKKYQPGDTLYLHKRKNIKTESDL